ncbi:MAG: hypothetical protein Q8R02_04380 [Hyphomonadaceae bacterium]|nr:hypothetical protein [Hyphomonadaceae bacterium]
MMRNVLAASLLALSLAACATTPSAPSDTEFAGCAAYKPAYDVTDRFMSSFNSKNAEAWGATFHFPSVRIASGNVRIINSAADLENSFATLGAQGWDHSAWAARKVVQCADTKAHMLTTFVRYRADGSELSKFNSLYIVEFKNNRWALTARSSFAP